MRSTPAVQERKEGVQADRVRLALVTGANRGIGAEVARCLAQLGINVMLAARTLDKASKACAEVQPVVPGMLTPMQLDVTDQASVDTAARRIEDEFEPIDILVNNAAVHYDTWETVLDADIDGVVGEALATNLVGPWRLLRAFAPMMRFYGYGRIVNVSSGAGSITTMGAGPPAYQVSKAALNALTRTLAAELEGSGVLVNAVCPGWVATDMGGKGGRSVTDGAAGIVWAATLDGDGPTGGFFRDGKAIPW